MLMLLFDLLAAVVFNGVAFIGLTVAWLVAGEDGWEFVERWLNRRGEER